MLTISLEEMKFHAAHGVYPEEKRAGNTFIVQVSVSIEETGLIDKLSQTADYEKIYEIIAEEMRKPAAMLETIAGHCAGRIKYVFPSIKIMEIKISKLHPPVGGEVGRSSVTLHKTYNDDDDV
jgi:dihydroneopterin aldolase